MASVKVSALTKSDIVTAARRLHWNRQMPKWTVVVEGQELPARPLVLNAAGVPPNDPTNSHQAVAILKEHGFDVRYQGKSVHDEHDAKSSEAQFHELLTSLPGSPKARQPLAAFPER